MFAILAPFIPAAQGEDSVVIPVPTVDAPAPVHGAYSYQGRNSYIGLNSYTKQVHPGDSDTVIAPPDNYEGSGAYSYQGRNSYIGLNSYTKQTRSEGSDTVIAPPDESVED